MKVGKITVVISIFTVFSISSVNCNCGTFFVTGSLTCWYIWNRFDDKDLRNCVKTVFFEEIFLRFNDNCIVRVGQIQRRTVHLGRKLIGFVKKLFIVHQHHRKLEIVRNILTVWFNTDRFSIFFNVVNVFFKLKSCCSTIDCWPCYISSRNFLLSAINEYNSSVLWCFITIFTNIFRSTVTASSDPQLI